MADSLLVGSINLSDPEEVFATVGAALGSDLRRVPDGETGDRLMWVMSLLPRIAAVETLQRADSSWGEEEMDHDFVHFRPRDGVDPAAVEFGNLGYADDALASWKLFKAAVDKGVLPAETRFQVCLPSAFIAITCYISPEHRAAVAPAYERALAREIDRMVDGIPAERLAIQWDLAFEIGAAEEFGPPPTWTFDEVCQQVGRLAALVPDNAELGLHLCYGDPPDEETGHGKHWLEPKDAAAMVRLTHGILGHVHRRIDWVHMPVPIERDDDAFFRPLTELELPAETDLYLGLIHFEDGVDGAQRRVDAAARHVSSFGVATECGIGRIPREEVLPTLELHRAVVAPA